MNALAWFDESKITEGFCSSVIKFDYSDNQNEQGKEGNEIDLSGVVTMVI